MIVRTVAIASLAAALVLPGLATAEAAGVTRGLCAPSTVTGGEWPVLGGPGLMGAGNQPAEDRIGPDNVAGLELTWKARSTHQSVPIVAGQCVYATDVGHIRAFDLDDGGQVFETTAETSSAESEFQPFAAAVAEDRVHLGYEAGHKPQAAAFDASTGQLLWKSEVITFGYEAWQLSSATVFDGLQLFPTTGPDFDPLARPGYALLDAATGATVHKQTTIPTKDLDDGYAGGGIWGTPSIDPVSGYAFVGTANPYSKTKEHAYDNAVVKIDMRKGRATFGTVVDSYKGEHDNLVGDPAYAQPACQAVGPSMPGPVNPPCAQLDVDFGNGPTMWHNAEGKLRLSIIQKSGMVHTLDAETMEPLWTRLAGTNSTATLTGGNHAPMANDGKRVFVPANPGTLWALDGETGDVAWTAAMTPTLGISSQNVIYANGVVYGIDLRGVHAWDAQTGAVLWDYAGSSEGLSCGGETGGVAMAHHTLVVNCSGTIAAFRLPS